VFVATFVLAEERGGSIELSVLAFRATLPCDPPPEV
jgi:hypothetical protein